MCVSENDKAEPRGDNIKAERTRLAEMADNSFREAAAQAFEDAASMVRCFSSQLPGSDGKCFESNDDICQCCLASARLIGTAKAIRDYAKTREA